MKTYKVVSELHGREYIIGLTLEEAKKYVECRVTINMFHDGVDPRSATTRLLYNDEYRIVEETTENV